MGYRFDGHELIYFMLLTAPELVKKYNLTFEIPDYEKRRKGRPGTPHH